MKNKGFTLVELLVVIVIIGILAAAAISVFGGGTDKAKKAVMNADVSAMYSAGNLGNAAIGYDVDRGIFKLQQQGYISSIPTNPYLNDDVTDAFYGYVNGTVSVGGENNPAIYAAGNEALNAGVFSKGSGFSMATTGVITATGTIGTSDSWTSSVPAS